MPIHVLFKTEPWRRWKPPGKRSGFRKKAANRNITPVVRQTSW
jgi:hypothetical protein